MLHQAPEALEWTRIALLSKVADDEDTRYRVSSTLREFYDADTSKMYLLSRTLLLLFVL
jgi:hypothetical protein